MQDDSTMAKFDLYRKAAAMLPEPGPAAFAKVGEAIDSMLVTAPSEALALADLVCRSIEEQNPALLDEATDRVTKLVAGITMRGKGGSA